MLPEAVELLGAVWELCTDRPQGVGIAPIPGLAIRDYARFHRITDLDDFDTLNAVVRSCDRLIMAHLAKETK